MLYLAWNGILAWGLVRFSHILLHLINPWEPLHVIMSIGSLKLVDKFSRIFCSFLKLPKVNWIQVKKINSNDMSESEILLLCVVSVCTCKISIGSCFAFYKNMQQRHCLSTFLSLERIQPWSILACSIWWQLNTPQSFFSSVVLCVSFGVSLS